MRIRKRFPPPASSTNLSDPQHHNSLLVQHQQQEQVHFPLATQQDKSNSQPSDPPNHAQEKMVLVLTNNNKDGFGQIKNYKETRKESIQCGETSSEAKMAWPSSHQVFEGWFGEDRAIPIKKRRGSLGKRASEDSIRKDDDEEKAMAKMKSKMNKKCVQENGDNEVPQKLKAGKEDSLSKEGIDIDLNTTIVCDEHDVMIKKNVKRGSVIMEGSRCSRVNGRGWRCCQQTLVGYSLCEHHLGKGRLRNMNNVRNRAKSKKGSIEITSREKTPRVQEKKKEIVSIDHVNEEDDDDEDDGVMKNKKKIGMVKARSISSLLGLGQGEGEVVVDEDK